MLEEEKIVPMEINLPTRLLPADQRFILFLRKAVYPITEEQIVGWYQSYVQRAEQRERSKEVNGVWQSVIDDYSGREILTYALAWFDRSLGRAIRKNILTKAEGLAVQPIKELAA